MGLWAGIKYALNSTLGTEDFKSLDFFANTTKSNTGDFYIPKLTSDVFGNILATSSVQTGPSYTIAVDNDYLYYADSSLKKVVKMDINSLVVVQSSVAQTGYSRSILVDDDYLYYSDYTSKKIIKMNKSDLSVISSSSILTGVTSKMCMDDDYLYYSDSSNGFIIKLSKSTLSVVNTSTTEVKSIYDMVLYGDYLYYGGIYSSTIRVVATNKNTLITETISPSFSGVSGSIQSVEADDYFVYFSDNTTKKIYKLEKNTLEIIIESSAFPEFVRTMVGNDDFLYISLRSLDGIIQIKKTNLDSVYTSKGYGIETVDLLSYNDCIYSTETNLKRAHVTENLNSIKGYFKVVKWWFIFLKMVEYFMTKVN